MTSIVTSLNELRIGDVLHWKEVNDSGPTGINGYILFICHDRQYNNRSGRFIDVKSCGEGFDLEYVVETISATICTVGTPMFPETKVGRCLVLNESKTIVLNSRTILDYQGPSDHPIWKVRRC